MALGARRATFLVLVIRRGLVLTVAGIGGGVALSLAACAGSNGLLFGVEPRPIRRRS
jgi:hypothetical protein